MASAPAPAPAVVRTDNASPPDADADASGAGLVVLAGAAAAMVVWQGTGWVLRTRLGFHTSRLWNRVVHGTDFTFHAISGAGVAPLTLAWTDSAGLVQHTELSDTRRTPLVLSGIPSCAKHLEDVLAALPPRTAHARAGGAPLVVLHTLNEPWECVEAGLDLLLVPSQALAVQSHLYPTPDGCAPAYADLLRAVRNLDSRDEDGACACVVHCKAGRGRSAVVVAAYLGHLAYGAGARPSARELETALVSRRPQVELSRAQRGVLQRFLDELYRVGDLHSMPPGA